MVVITVVPLSVVSKYRREGDGTPYENVAVISTMVEILNRTERVITDKRNLCCVSQMYR